MREGKFPPSLPANTKPFRYCNECPALTEDLKSRASCLTFGRLKTKSKSVTTPHGQDNVSVEEPVRHGDCKDKPRNAEVAVERAQNPAPGCSETTGEFVFDPATGFRQVGDDV
jgi:hypothetical protein